MVDTLDDLIANLDFLSALEDDGTKPSGADDLDDLLDEAIAERSVIMRKPVSLGKSGHSQIKQRPSQSSTPRGSTIQSDEAIRAFQNDFGLSEDKGALLDNLLEGEDSEYLLPAMNMPLPPIPRGSVIAQQELDRQKRLTLQRNSQHQPSQQHAPQKGHSSYYQDPLDELESMSKIHARQVSVDGELANLLDELGVDSDGTAKSSIRASAWNIPSIHSDETSNTSAADLALGSTLSFDEGSDSTFTSPLLSPQQQTEQTQAAGFVTEPTENSEVELDKLLDALETEGSIDELKNEFAGIPTPQKQAAPIEDAAAARVREFEEWKQKFDTGRSASTPINFAHQALPGAPPCVKCARGLGMNVTVTSLGKFHPECWTCTTCNNSLLNVGFQIVDCKPYCNPCSHNVFSHRCSRCDLPIPGAKIVAFGKNWHQQCFVCSMCNGDLSRGYVPMQGVAICGSCFQGQGGHIQQRSHYKVCTGCRNAIGPTEEALQAGSPDQLYHRRCFICANCKGPITSSYYMQGGYPYCDKIQWKFY
eukprot:TRINITY_DN3238_c0_g1_i1.p1 TRINITY_DN3238_c0_g1~~TRINITY_DN3238_c0_g1_i1.p1  ORF type:complete len:533 (-),score=67.48 TRINITY_DN3238_c0_g1_i1:2-1600(-)